MTPLESLPASERLADADRQIKRTAAEAGSDSVGRVE
jgi:hypothetical protein